MNARVASGCHRVPMRVIAALVRHGKYEQPESVPSGHLPHPLTAEGEEQARALPARLTELARRHGATLHPVLDSSRMLRAWQTARLAAHGLGATFTVEEFDALAERSLGAAANLTLQEIARVIARDPRFGPLAPGWKLTRDFRLPLQGAESLAEAGVRTARHIEERAAFGTGADDGTAMKIFVGHGGAFRHAAVTLGALPADSASKLSMWHCSPVLLERNEAATWRHLDGAWKAREVREPAHERGNEHERDGTD